MKKLCIKQGEWVVVCDGQKALLLQNAGDDKFPNLQTKEVFEYKNDPTRDQGTDAPGRSMNSVGSARSAMEQTDWHEQAERDFLVGLAGRLDAALSAGSMQALIVVAPPKALGIIRQAYSPHSKGALRAEIDKDLVKMPVHEIERHLTGHS